MTNPTPTQPPSTPEPSTSQSSNLDRQPTPLQCLIGAAISGALATVLYFLTTSVISTFANKPLPSGNTTAINISIAVRTLVTGLSTLGTAIFAISALGLVALAIQLAIQSPKKSPS
jgi:hypothetical protein